MLFRSQRRLAELEALIEGLPAKIAALETALADPALYGRDPAGFERFSRALAAAQAQLASAEDEWLTLESQREAAEAGT